MKKILLILLTCLLVVGCTKKDEKFYFNDEYYQSTELINTNSSEINKLIDEKKSFGVILYTPGCTSCIKFEALMETFRQEKNMSFYNLSAEEMQKTIINGQKQRKSHYSRRYDKGIKNATVSCIRDSFLFKLF